MEIFIVVLAVVGLTMMLYAMNAAYYNGVNDGYGAARERNNPGYRKARAWLIANRTHSWPELKHVEEEDQC